MREPGLDNRHRDKNGEISRKHGNTLVGTLRKLYGPSFAPGCQDEEQLSSVLHRFDETSLSKLRKDHDGHQLGAKIKSYS
jgi:hypothetical protein